MIASTLRSVALRFFAVMTMLLTGALAAMPMPSVSAQGFSNVAIVTTENGQPAYDACYIFVGYSEIGCDENGDGKVTFEDIPLGTWTVHQTANLGSGRYVNDFTVRVTGAASSDGWERFTATIQHSGSTSSTRSGGASRSSDIAIVTTENGQPVYDACYVIGDYSNEGCDENGDGKITFEDIPLGTWTVHQTRNLGSGRTVADFTIRVTGNASSDGWERFPAKVTRSGSASSSTRTGTTGSSGRSGSNGSANSSTSGQRTWVASVQVICDDSACESGKGIKVDISLASGELLGSCVTRITGEFMGNTIASCSVDGMPFHADFVARQDPATIPAGYVPVNETLTLHVDDIYPGGGDGAIFTFRNDRTSGASAASPKPLMLTITAKNCQAPKTSGGCKNAKGARFTVTTESGKYLGECTIGGHGDEPYLVSCGVEVPDGSTVIVTEDISTIGDGLAPETNPIVWDTSKRPVPPNVPSFWGPIFNNLPASSSTAPGNGA